MSNSWALRGIKAILRNKRVNKPRLKDRSWQLKLRQKNRYITALENRTERLESEIEAYRRLCRGLGHQMGRNQLNAEIFDLLVNGDFTENTTGAVGSRLSDQEKNYILDGLKEVIEILQPIASAPKTSPIFGGYTPPSDTGQQERLFLFSPDENWKP